MTTTASLLYPHEPRIVRDEEKKDEEESEDGEEEADEQDDVDDDVDDDVGMTDDVSDGEDVDIFHMHHRFSGNSEAQRRYACSLLQSYAAQSLDDAPMVVKSTAIFRKRIMEAWNA
jgi:hypothetical protein